MELKDLPERIRRRVVLKRPLSSEVRSFCWAWQGAKIRGGYASAYWEGKQRALHKALNPPPKGLECDHLCCRPECIRPSHIDHVTHAENIRRLIERGRAGRRGERNRIKTSCVNGHEFSPENTLPNAYGKGRRCRTCKNEHEKMRKRQLRAEARRV